MWNSERAPHNMAAVDRTLSMHQWNCVCHKCCLYKATSDVDSKIGNCYCKLTLPMCLGVSMLVLLHYFYFNYSNFVKWLYNELALVNFVRGDQKNNLISLQLNFMLSANKQRKETKHIFPGPVLGPVPATVHGSRGGARSRTSAS